MSTEKYLSLFEDVINQQKELIGSEKALAQAKKAGLSVSSKGHIASCVGNPHIVLLRLIKYFTADNNIASLEKCLPLIAELERMQAELDLEENP